MQGAESPKHWIYLPFEQKQKQLYYCLKVIDIIIQMWCTRLREAKVKPKACLYIWSKGAWEKWLLIGKIFVSWWLIMTNIFK